MKTQLDKQQSQHLIDLGVPKEKASAFEYIGELEWDIYDQYNDTPINEKAPIFTLTDLLEILPKEIEDIETDWWLELWIDYSVPHHKWIVGYYAISDKDRGVQFTKNSTELIDALYELCVWCLENNYIKL